MDGYQEALLLDVEGFVAEGSGENVFIVRNGKLYTPDLTSALEGITRDEVYCADEAFFTGTAAEVTPIRELDRIELGKEGYVDSRGPITEKIQSAFFDIVNGRNPKYAHWLAKV